MPNDMWYLLSDFFYKHKCCNGFIDPSDPDFHSFKKRNCIYGVRRINDHSYKIKQWNTKNNKEQLFENIDSLEKVIEKLEELIK